MALNNKTDYPSSETSSDLEWMLQSGQASSTELAEALLKEFYVPVYRLALYLLEDQAAARATPPDAFIAALLNAYAFRSATGVRLWFFDLALKTCLEKRRKLRPGLSFIGSLDDSYRGAGLKSDLISPTPDDEILGIWFALEALEYRPRFIAFLHFALDLNASEIARLLHFKESEVETGLETAQRQLAVTRAVSIGIPTDISVFSKLSQALKARWPVIELAEPDLVNLASRIADQARRGETKRRRQASLKEIVLIGVIILGAVGLTWGVNRFRPEPQPNRYPSTAVLNVSVPTRTNVIYFVQRGDTLDSIAANLGMRVDELVAINAISTADPLYSGESLWVDISAGQRTNQTPVTPVPPAAPLTINSSSQAVQQRLKESVSLWQTLYVDIQYYPNGPNSTAGMYNLYRDQIWLNQPGQSMEAFGLPNDQIFMRRIASGERGYTILGTSGEAYIDNDWFPIGGQLLRNPLLQALIFPGQADWFRPHWDFKPIASEAIAGRPALVVDWVNPQGLPEARLWIDTVTGVILRRQFFGNNEPGNIISEVAVTNIVYDVDIPARIFDPNTIWQAGFAPDYTGGQALK
jgi:DNA-directed RNA polymerase specialized sigma24 family protein